MPRHEEGEERKGGGAGRRGKGEDDEGHGKPGHEHGEGRGGDHGKHGGGGGGHGRRGRGGGDSDDSGGDDDDDDDEEDGSSEAKDEEAKHPGWIKAGRRASRKWKRQHDMDVKTPMRDFTPEQRKEVRVAKRTARRHFVAAQEKA